MEDGEIVEVVDAGHERACVVRCLAGDAPTALARRRRITLRSGVGLHQPLVEGRLDRLQDRGKAIAQRGEFPVRGGSVQAAASMCRGEPTARQ